LLKRYYHGDIFRISYIKEETYVFYQGHLNKTTYFTQSNNLWQDDEWGGLGCI